MFLIMLPLLQEEDPNCTCARTVVPDPTASFLEIPMIFCRHIPWVVLECSAKFRCNCNFQLKNYIFALLSKSILVIPTKPGKDIAWGRTRLLGTLSGNITSNDLDPGKCWPL